MSVSTLQQPARSRWGLTILELIIGVAIVAALTAVAVPQYVAYVARVRFKEAVTDIQMIESAIERYRTELGQLPDDLAAAVSPLPVDPWGNPYEYLNLQNTDDESKSEIRKDKNLHPINSDYDLYSKGADGESKAPLTAKDSRDDIIRANDGAFIGLAEDY